MNVELLPKPQLLIDHVGDNYTVWCLHLILTAVPPAQSEVMRREVRTSDTDSSAIFHYPILGQIPKLSTRLLYRLM